LRVTRNECEWRRTSRACLVVLAVGVCFSLGTIGCASKTKPKGACAVFYASENLNLYEGEPHPITVYVYPLSSQAGFVQANVEDLLEGDQPTGVMAPPIPITVAPGEERFFKEVFPPNVVQLGILADYYREDGDPEGSRTVVVKARCGMRKPKLTLSPKDIYIK
jgi:type VI secretion system VasD/TssJ family lipoprotein